MPITVSMRRGCPADMHTSIGAHLYENLESLVGFLAADNYTG